MWILWIIRLKSTDSGGAASGGRRDESFSLGLWQITHSCVLSRWPPWSASRPWHWLQLARSTTVRRGSGVPPSTAE